MMIVIMLKRLLFLVATIIIATTVASSASKCEERTNCSKCFNANPKMNCVWIILSDKGSCADADDNNQCNNGEITLSSTSSGSFSSWSCATGVNIKTRNKMKKKKWKRKNRTICHKLKKSIPNPPKSCSDYSGNCKVVYLKIIIIIIIMIALGYRSPIVASLPAHYPKFHKMLVVIKDYFLKTKPNRRVKQSN
jgi:hypothetical protein